MKHFATIEEIAAKAGVSKPVVYEHFGGKEGLYAVVVDREMASLLAGVTASWHLVNGGAGDVDRIAAWSIRYGTCRALTAARQWGTTQMSWCKRCDLGQARCLAFTLSGGGACASA